MGILNVTPDSFSDGGHHMALDSAITHSLGMIEYGVDIIDIGGESSRPGAEPVSADEELARVMPVISALRRRSDIPISIDTYKATVAEQALEAGADIVNDISALRMDARIGDVVSRSGAPVIMMHMLGTPLTMQQNPQYDNCVEEIIAFFRERIAFCEQKGIRRDRLILDPGIGFGKRLEDNLAILAGLGKFSEFGLPILVGASRKWFIGQVHKAGQSASERLGGSIAAALVAVERGADIVRVHDVAETVEALRVLGAIAEKS
jgi:dihydropteroate synthase